MAKLGRDDVLKLAELAKLDLTEDEVEQFSREFSDILAYVEQLQGANVDGLDPTYQVTGLKNVTRQDKLQDYSAQGRDLLKNVPQTKDGYIKVRRIL